jgi:hypothetical protein
MSQPDNRPTLALEGGVIAALSLYVALMISGQLRRIDETPLLIGGLVGVALAYFWARVRRD